jgi:hypothetical protein
VPVLGLGGHARHYGDFGLGSPLTATHFTLGPPEFVNVATGPGKTLACIELAVVLLSTPAGPVALLVNRSHEHHGGPPLTVQATSPTEGSRAAGCGGRRRHPPGRGARTDRAARPRAYTAPGRAGLTGPPPVARPAPLGPAGYGEDAHGPVPHGPGRRRDHDPPIGSNARHAERVRGAGAPPCPLSCRARRRRPDRAGTDVRPSPPAPGVSTWPSRSRFPTLQLGAGCSSSTAEGSTSPSTIPMRSSTGPRASPRRSSRSSCVEPLSRPPRPAARP